MIIPSSTFIYTCKSEIIQLRYMRQQLGNMSAGIQGNIIQLVLQEMNILLPVYLSN